MPRSGSAAAQIPAQDALATGEAVRTTKAPAAFRSIGEASAELGLKPHVLRFWETRFPQLDPMKRDDGRRYFRPEDMALLRRIRDLLHEDGMTIRGAQKVLESETRKSARPSVAAPSVRELQQTVQHAVDNGLFRSEDVRASDVARERLTHLLDELSDLKSRLDKVRSVA